MWIKDLFNKRKPNHLVIYLDHDNKDGWLFKLFSKITYSIGPVKTLDEVISKLEDFKKRYPYKIKYITINTYGRGRHLVNTKELKSEDGEKKLDILMKELITMLDENGFVQFATCYGGLAHRKLVEISEKYNGINVASMYGEYSLKGNAVVCKCKEIGFSEKIKNSLPQSRNGLLEDEVKIVDTYTRKMGEEVNWNTCGMAYVYNKITIEEGVCKIEKQPFSSLECVMNYLFNIQ